MDIESDNYLTFHNFSYEISMLKSRLGLTVNWTEDSSASLKGYLSVTDPYFFFNNITNKPSLIIARKPAEFEAKMLRNEEGEIITEMKQTGEQVSQVINLIGNTLAGLLGFTFLMGFGGAAIAKLMSLFETINR